jgi:hypothetical protein
MSWVGFEPTMQALERAATVTGYVKSTRSNKVHAVSGLQWKFLVYDSLTKIKVLTSLILWLISSVTVHQAQVVIRGDNSYHLTAQQREHQPAKRQPFKHMHGKVPVLNSLIITPWRRMGKWIHVLFISAQVGGEWSASLPGRFIPRHLLDRRLGGP